MIKSLTGSALALACAFGLAACRDRAVVTGKPASEPSEHSVPIQTGKVEMRSIPSFLEVTGELRGGRTSAVAADASGKVRETLIERGSVVKDGDVLVKLDDRAAVLTLRETEAAVDQAQVRLDLARADWQRNQQLAKQKLIAPAEAQKLESDVRGREADLAAAEARRDSARKTLEDTEVRAPFAGTVAERLVNAGEYVQPGTRVVVMIAIEDLRLWLNVPETAAGAVYEGQNVSFRVPAFPGSDFAATVRYISPIVRETGRDLLVEAEVDADERRLLQGMFAEVRLALREHPALVVPATSVRTDAGVHKVLVTEGDHLLERIVDIGMATDAWTEIRSGLAEGETVVVQPTRETRDGVRFTIAAR